MRQKYFGVFSDVAFSVEWSGRLNYFSQILLIDTVSELCNDGKHLNMRVTIEWRGLLGLQDDASEYLRV